MSSGKRVPARSRFVPTSDPAGPRLDDRMAATALGCPNGGRCRHGSALHDGDGNDEPWICCVDGCACDGRVGATVPG